MSGVRTKTLLCCTLLIIFLLGLPKAANGSSTAFTGVSVSSTSTTTTPTTTLLEYDLQYYLTYTNSTGGLSDTVTATFSPADPFQDEFLLNGLTIVNGVNRWYQIGLSNIWGADCNDKPCIGQHNIHVNYEVFENGNSIEPDDGGGGTINFIGTVNPGDKVTLNLLIANNKVYMNAVDQNTGAYGSIVFNAHGATAFQGLKTGEHDQYGDFTGPMTEWWHLAPYYGNEAYQNYVPAIQKSDPAWMTIDEFSADPIGDYQGTVYIDRVTPTAIGPKPSFIWTANPSGTGAGEEYFNNGNFITGVNATTEGQISNP